MRLMHCALALILCIAVLATRTSAHEPVDWKQTNFGVLEHKVGGYSVKVVLQHLCRTPEYAGAFERKEYWSCIRQVLEQLAAGEREIEKLDMSSLDKEMYEGIQQLHEIQMSHSGRRWSFWYGCALLRQAYTELGLVLSDDAERLFGQMEASFLPLLDPQSYPEEK